MSQTLKQTEESPNFYILILFVLLGKVFYDFKSMGGFNYALLIKIIYMILIIFLLIILFHGEDIKTALKKQN